MAGEPVGGAGDPVGGRQRRFTAGIEPKDVVYASLFVVGVLATVLLVALVLDLVHAGPRVDRAALARSNQVLAAIEPEVSGIELVNTTGGATGTITECSFSSGLVTRRPSLERVWAIDDGSRPGESAGDLIAQLEQLGFDADGGETNAGRDGTEHFRRFKRVVDGESLSAQLTWYDPGPRSLRLYLDDFSSSACIEGS